MGEIPPGKKNWVIEVLLGINRLTQVFFSPLANLIDERSISGPYGNSRYTWCGTVGKTYRIEYGGYVPWSHPIAAFIQHLTEFWYRDKKHTKEAANHEEAPDYGLDT